jgi:hypothetical protein
MDPLIDSIRAAVADGASDDAKDAGAQACRAILAALEAQGGAPLASAPSPASPIAAAVATLRTIPPDQLLDLVIAKLRLAVPATDAPATATAAAPRFVYLPIPGKTP